MAQEAERRGPSALTLVLANSWLVLGVLQVADDYVLNGELASQMSGGEGSESSIIVERQTILDELMSGGGPDPEDDDYFRNILFRALSYAGIPIATIANLMHVSESTVRRWTDGEAEPHPLMRRTLYDVLKDWLQKNPN